MRRGRPGAVGTVVLLAVMLAAGCRNRPATTPQPAGEVSFRYGDAAHALELVLSSTEMTVADRLVVELRAGSPAASEPAFPDVTAGWGQFTLVRSRVLGPVLADGDRRVTTWRGELEPFLPGTYTLTPVTVTFRSSAGLPAETAAEVTTEPVSVLVTSLLPDAEEASDIEDITAIRSLPGRTWLWVWGSLGVGALLVAGALALWWRRRRTGSDDMPTRLPHEVAYDRLDALMAGGLPRPEDAKPFYQRLTDILRCYIEARFGLHAPEQTTEEFLADLQGSPALSDLQKRQLARFLQHCDLVKFAKLLPESDQIRETAEAVRTFVDQTRTAPRPPKVVGA